MSVFSFPRLNVKGLIAINVGTANNDDYSSDRFPPEWGPYAGLPLRLADSINVQPLTYGLSDEEYLRWVQEPQSFIQARSASAKAEQTHAEIPATERPANQQGRVLLIPAEWNYYGDMGLTMMGVRIQGVHYRDRLVTNPDEDPLIGAELSFKNRPGDTGRSTGMIIDVNPEQVPSSQVFADSLLLEKNGQALLQGKPTKAVTRWINFQRNINLRGPNGAGACFQCAVPLEEIQGQPLAEWMARHALPGKKLKGVVFRYYLFRTLQPISTYKYPDQNQWFAEMVALYKKKGLNPVYAQITGTISPWYDEEMASVPTGRPLQPPAQQSGRIPLPDGRNIGLAPAMVEVDYQRRVISLDCSGSFPDQYQNPEADPFQTDIRYNPKFDFGAVYLVVQAGQRGYDFGPIPYANTANGDQRGWIFDFPIPSLTPDFIALIEQGTFSLRHPQYGCLLEEAEHFIASDQACIYAEQGPPGSKTHLFQNQGGAEEPATIRVFRKGKELSPAGCPSLTVWQYDTTPNQVPGKAIQLAANFKPGQPLVVPTDRPGNRLFAFLPEGMTPPSDASALNLMTVPQINLRILPNNRDYRRYYRNPDAEQPIGNDLLTFDVIYQEVLRNYYLLYPGMSQRIPLNDPDYWADPEMAGRLMQRTQKSWWGRAEYMPRTRDLSESRRKLLQAWCLKFLVGDDQ